MRLVSYEYQGQEGFGMLSGDQVLPLGGYAGAPSSLRDWLAAGADAPRPRHEGLPLAEVRLLPPVPDAGKIFCVAVNFHEPAREGKPLPDYPLLFTRFADSLVGHGAELIRPQGSDQYDFEGELAVVIGRPGFRIAREEAMAHVAGYSCFNDGSLRDWQKHSSQFTAGKNAWRSGSFGPWLVSADEIPDPSALTLETRVNGVVRQAISLDRLIFDIPWLIAYLSAITPLAPGDVIATGTPTGFGSSRRPPEFLAHGDVVEVEISRVGTLRNAVAAVA